MKIEGQTRNLGQFIFERWEYREECQWTQKQAREVDTLQSKLQNSGLVLLLYQLFTTSLRYHFHNYMCIRFALWCQSFQHIALHSWWREVYWLTLGNVNTNHTKFWDLMGQFQNAIWTVKALKWASKVIYDEIYIIFKMAMLLLFLKIESSTSYFLCIYTNDSWKRKVIHFECTYSIDNHMTNVHHIRN